MNNKKQPLTSTAAAEQAVEGFYMQNKGRFIVVEGLEGAGKSTVINFIKRFLSNQRIELTLTREPGGTRVGEMIRNLIKEIAPDEPLDPRAELLLLYAARTQLIEQVIRPSLQRGGWVLSDRFELSTFAYQGGGRKLDSSMIKRLSDFCLAGLQPDLTIFLDVSPQKGLQRARKRSKADRIEQESLAFFDDVYAAYHDHLKNLQHVIMIDATQPLGTVQHLIYTGLEKYIADWVTHTQC